MDDYFVEEKDPGRTIPMDEILKRRSLKHPADVMMKGFMDNQKNL